MGLGLAWAFLAVPLVVIANNVDPTLARVLLGLAAAPIIIAGVGIMIFVAIAPLFARGAKVRAIVAPIVFLAAYALEGLTFAVAYLLAVLLVWGALSVLKMRPS